MTDKQKIALYERALGMIAKGQDVDDELRPVTITRSGLRWIAQDALNKAKEQA